MKAHAESWQHIEVDQVVDATRLEEIRTRIMAVLDDVRVAVADWPQTRARAERDRRRASRRAARAAEIGCRRGERLHRMAGGQPFHLPRVSRVPPFARPNAGPPRRPCRSRGSGCCEPAASGRGRGRPCSPARSAAVRANRRSWSSPRRTRSRPCIARRISTTSAVKTFDDDGEVTGERRFIGLFTSSTYSAKPARDPAAARRRCSAWST